MCRTIYSLILISIIPLSVIWLILPKPHHLKKKKKATSIIWGLLSVQSKCKQVNTLQDVIRFLTCVSSLLIIQNSKRPAYVRASFYWEHRSLLFVLVFCFSFNGCFDSSLSAQELICINTVFLKVVVKFSCKTVSMHAFQSSGSISF